MSKRSPSPAHSRHSFRFPVRYLWTPALLLLVFCSGTLRADLPEGPAQQTVRLSAADAWPSDAEDPVFGGAPLNVHFVSLQGIPAGRARMVVYLASNRLAAPLSPPVAMNVSPEVGPRGTQILEAEFPIPAVDRETALILQVEYVVGEDIVVCRKRLLAIPADLTSILHDLSRFRSIWLDPRLEDMRALGDRDGVTFSLGDRLPASFQPEDLWIGLAEKDNARVPDAPTVILFDPTLTSTMVIREDLSGHSVARIQSGADGELDNPNVYRNFRQILLRLLENP